MIGQWWIVIVLIVLVFLSIRWDKKRIHRIKLHHQTLIETTILGHFQSDENQSWYIFTYKSDDEYVCHIQGTPHSQDRIWIRDGKDPNSYIISENCYAELVENQAIQIMDISLFPSVKLHTLTRMEVKCPILETNCPSLKTVNEFYDLFYIHPDEYPLMQKLILQKKCCANINDWALNQTFEKVEEGVFAVDKKKTCFFYVMPHLVHLYGTNQYAPKEGKASDFEQLLFAGVAIT